MLLPGAMYADAQSYRYLMPLAAIVALSIAAGCAAAWRRNRTAGAVLAGLILFTYAAGEYRWYERLAPEPGDREVLACMSQHGLHIAKADYWLAYKLTFLSAEQVLVLP